jgi:phospholipid/cholesterol/gamma-HCH transport system permease protein
MIFERIGESVLGGLQRVGKLALFSGVALLHMRDGGNLRARLVRAIFEIGVRCVPVTIVIATFTGMVLGLQGHHVLSRFGATEMLGTLVSLSLCREMAPVLAALMIVAQAGTALCAEIGIQRSTEQIDAIELLNIHAEGFLVGARLAASLFVFPVLTAVFVMVGVWGGWISGCVIAPEDSDSFWASVHAAIHPHDVIECLLKSLVFGLLTITITAFEGFHSHEFRNVAGARAVSLATVRGVVFSCVAILAADYVITAWMV